MSTLEQEIENRRDTVEYVAIGPFAWGKGPHVRDAVRLCKMNLQDFTVKKSVKENQPIPVRIYHVKGFWYVDGDTGQLVALDDSPGSGVLSRRKIYWQPTSTRGKWWLK